jgi:CRISPR-associated protein Csx3
MSNIELQVIPHITHSGLEYNHLHIQITTDNGIISPDDIKGLKLPSGIDFTKGVVIEGKAPIWLYGYLVHESHPAAWVGCYDTRFLGVVVVETHTHDVAISEIFTLDLPDGIFLVTNSNN